MTDDKRLGMRKCWMWSIGLVAALACQGAAALTVTTPGSVLMIDGLDSDVTVKIGAVDATLPLSAYDFGFFDAISGYTPITTSFNVGSHVFTGGTLVDFTLRNRGADNMFGTGDDTLYRMSDLANYTTQIYLFAIDPSNSQNPVVTSPYYRSLALSWDLNLDGMMDAGFTIAVSKNKFDGMAPVAVPLPAALGLLGAGLSGLAAVGGIRRRRRV